MSNPQLAASTRNLAHPTGFRRIGRGGTLDLYVISSPCRVERHRSGGRRAWVVESGSLIVMDYATQLHYPHAVPKTSAAVGERISLAFGPAPRRPVPDPCLTRA